MECKNCKSVLIQKENESDYNFKKRITCNSSCAAKYGVTKKYNKYIQKWKTNKIKYTYNISDHIRKYLFEKYDNKCCRCGWSEINPVTNKIPLEINHIDGNGKNHDEKNLELICPNCHSLTHNYKALNKGFGRKNRTPL